MSPPDELIFYRLIQIRQETISGDRIPDVHSGPDILAARL
jgi:hypothetical protein